MQYWLVERVDENGVRFLYLCTASDREIAKRMAKVFIPGDPETFVVTPLSHPREVAKMQINIQATF